jgi:hypothetical protein
VKSHRHKRSAQYCAHLSEQPSTDWKIWSRQRELNPRPSDYKFPSRSYAIHSKVGHRVNPSAYSAWQALIEPDFEPNCGAHTHRRQFLTTDWRRSRRHSGYVWLCRESRESESLPLGAIHRTASADSCPTVHLSWEDVRSQLVIPASTLGARAKEFNLGTLRKRATLICSGDLSACPSKKPAWHFHHTRTGLDST